MNQQEQFALLDSARVHVVITNWKRASNVRRIVQAFREQSYKPHKITVCNNQPDGLFSASVFRSDDIWNFPDNGVGPTCRFAPALLNFTCHYTLFHDDDLIPGPGYISTLLRAAISYLDNQFATISTKGRIYREGKWYVQQNVTAKPYECVPVDCTIRSHLVRTELLPAVLDHIHAVKQWAMDSSHTRWIGQDDMFLSHGIQQRTGFHSYIHPAVSKEGRMNQQELADNDAYSSNHDHVQTRHELISYSNLAGWRSLLCEREPLAESSTN